MTRSGAVATEPHPPLSPLSSLVGSASTFPPDVSRLLDVLVRIELRRRVRLQQARLRMQEEVMG